MKQIYHSKLTSADEAISTIRSGQRIFIGSSCGEPQHLVNTLLLQKERFKDLEILRLLSLEGSISNIYGDMDYGHTFTVRSIYEGAGSTDHLNRGRRFFMPMDISLIPRLFLSRQLRIHHALAQVSPPDEFGWMSLGISVDITKAAVKAADRVIVQVNPLMPRTMGQSFIHVSEVDMIVEAEEKLLTTLEYQEPESSEALAILLANLIEDGSTLQIGLGYGSEAITKALSQKKDLGVHSQDFTDSIMQLMQSGAVNNRKKTRDEGKSVASTAIGTEDLYRFIHNNPAVELHPSDYVNNPAIIARHHRMTAINPATAIDLTGQVAVDALPQNHFSGVSGILDFVTGAVHSPGGSSILVLPSTTPDGRQSRIVPELRSGSVVIPRSDVYHVVSEFGAVNLFGKSLQERAMALIGIAHPDFREELMQRAKAAGLVGKTMSVSDSLYGVYPAHLEEIQEVAGRTLRIRPVKSMDARRIQEHYYAMDKRDIKSRFFQNRVSFYRDQIESVYEIDYLKHMTVLAIEGNDDFGEIIGIGEYVLEPGRNTAEVAFSVSASWQGKGIGNLLLQKLAEAAQEHGISGLTAYTSPNNHSMVRLFDRLPYYIDARFSEDFLVLSCRFEEIRE